MKLTHQPMFLHLREHNVTTYDSKTNELVWELNPKGGITIAFTYEPNIIKYATAICNEKDHFNKYLGRVKAAGRLNSPRYVKELQVDEDITVSDAIKVLKEKIYEEREKYDESIRRFVF